MKNIKEYINEGLMDMFKAFEESVQLGTVILTKGLMELKNEIEDFADKDNNEIKQLLYDKLRKDPSIINKAYESSKYVKTVMSLDEFKDEIFKGTGNKNN